MKALSILLILINLAFSSTSIYDIKSEGEQIGTLDALTGELFDNSYKVLESHKQLRLEKRNSRDDEVEVMTISKEGKLLSIKDVDFEMTLRK